MPAGWCRSGVFVISYPSIVSLSCGAKVWRDMALIVSMKSYYYCFIIQCNVSHIDK